MAHKLECLNRRDRYMIGDWVLCNGKPYRWMVHDSYLTEVEMEEVEDIPLTAMVLYVNGFQNDVPSDVAAFDYTFDDGEEFCGITYPHETDSGLVLAYPLSNTPQLTYTFGVSISVAKLQHLLREAGCYNLAQRFSRNDKAMREILTIK